jgi:hypothetical protein
MALTKVSYSMITGAQVNVLDFGADPTGVNDSYAAITAAIAEAEVIANTYARGILTPLNRSSYPLVDIRFPPGKYLTQTQIVIPDSFRRYKLSGNNALIFSTAITGDYLVKCIGGYDAIIEGIAFGSTDTGCLEFACPNISSAMVQILSCTFIGGVDTATHGIGIKYLNQSSILVVRDCLFNNVQYAFEQEACDFVTFSNCWFDIVTLANYPDDAGYFKKIASEFTLEDCLFAAGPGVTTGQRVAYFNCDEAVNLTIRRTRITFEIGGGPIINWKVPINLAGGSFQRSGFTLEDITVSPRGQDETYWTSVATPLVRLYEMPNKMIFKNISWRNTIQGYIGVAPTTTLETLYQDAKAQLAGFSQTAYYCQQNVGSQMFFVPTTDSLVHKKWLELFNICNYEFEVVTPGNAATHYVKTFFVPGDRDESLLDVQLVAQFNNGNEIFPKRWFVSIVRNSTAGTYSFVADEISTTGPVQAQDLTLTPKFYQISTDTYSTTISTSATLSDYLIAFEATKTGTSNFQIYPIRVIPMNGLGKVGAQSGAPRQYLYQGF